MAEFNVLNHELVPEHAVVPEGEEKELFKKLRITKEQLPKIRKGDPVIQTLEEILGEVKEGTVIKITRRSLTAGVAVAYRVVVPG